MRGVMRAGRPSRGDERVLEVLLHVLDELLAARGDTKRLDVRGGVADDGCITRTERAGDVLLETRDELS